MTAVVGLRTAFLLEANMGRQLDSVQCPPEDKWFDCITFLQQCLCFKKAFSSYMSLLA